MAQAGQQTLTDFADELYLAYLRLHSAWGCPGRIPAEARAWTPAPTPALITEAAARGFRDRVEDAARATAPTEKRGGLTYARAVRVLHEAVARALRTALHPGPVDVCGWAFDLAWSGELWIIDAPRPASSPHGPTEVAGTEGAPARRTRTVPRRKILGLFATVPPALTLGAGRALNHASGDRALAPTPTRPAEAAASAVAVEARPDAVIATALRALDGLPWADRRSRLGPEQTHCALARLRELATGPSVSAATLVRGLAATLTVDSSPRCRAAVARDIARAETVDHVRFHASALKLLLGRLRRYAAAGTTWYAHGPVAGMSWDGLVTHATFDVWNFCASLRMRDECVEWAADPLTFTDEIQVALGPVLVRLEAGNTRLIGPTLCAWVPPGRDGAETDRRARSHIWLLEDVGWPPS